MMEEMNQRKDLTVETNETPIKLIHSYLRFWKILILIAISLLTFGFDWIKNKFSLRPFLFPAEE